ncbi:hypothetical protein BKA82DRAFT_476882 [Pisolithus tinctorius]|uniref:Transcription activator of gluconeogenesis ERT1 n=1 Tax=Pisolithus tinctorius Marx 270 TaxID=870435 RepID=A0A0C3PJR0_PISTI|nr:hypothetical protein BKA82DRAFT_476882 [Pisolithus tinctorius]KIO14415.1 hypothetical protein M404DRAFT_476882 [Pisolithus tinctorius Marx 270]
MVNDQAKSAGPVTQEHPYPPTMAPYPQGFGATYPGYPIYFAQPPDASHGDGSNGTTPAPPFMIPIAAAPGMLYPYPPPPGQPYPQFQQPAPAAATSGARPKRKQVKMACTNCATACKRCDEIRPCGRCMKYGIQDSCVDGVRKERQKGIKRGPYKRKNKAATAETPFGGFPAAGGGDSEWQANGASSSNAPSSAAPAPVHTVSPYPPEAFYHCFLPPGFAPPGHEGGPAPDGTSNGTSQPSAMVPYFPFPPPGYFPFPPGVYPSPPNGTQVPTMDPADASRNASQLAESECRMEATGKKRSKGGKNGESKSKRAKAAPPGNNSETSTSGGTVGGSDQASEPGTNGPVEGDDA